MSESSTVFPEPKVYRFNLTYRLYHFAAASAALIGAIVWRDFLALSVILALFSVFMISRPLILAVTVDQSLVTYKEMFSAHSLQRSSIKAIERQHTGRANYLILWVNLDEKEYLRIPADLFAFDETWDDWLSTYRDLSDDKPLSLF
jgi:hypothetical protein